MNYKMLQMFSAFGDRHGEVHRRELMSVSIGTEAIFATGHRVGALACEVLGRERGVFIHREWGVGAALDKTAEPSRR